MRIKDRAEYNSKPKPSTLPPSAKVREAITRMAEGNFGSVVIVDPNDKVIGILTERDLLRRLLHENRNPDSTIVSDIMTSQVRLAKEDDNLLDWMRIMSNERFRHLPIVDDEGRIVNMMSQGDFVSYTWPELLQRFKETAKATVGSSYQIVIIIMALLAYALLVNIFH
nr:CBS domain-containing protein [Cytophagales bacterium]